MTKEKIIAYLLQTPHNTNPAVVESLLDELLSTKMVSSQEELVAALAEGGEVALTGDVEINQDIILTKNTNLDLNGKKIIASKEHSGSYMLKADGADLTIYGKGLISAGEAANAIPVTATNGAKVKIMDGEYEGRGHLQCVYTNGGKAEIYGGVYRAVEGDETKDLLNVKNTDKVEDIRVYGGTFIGRDPSLGDDALGGNFVVEGCRSVEIKKGVFKVEK